MSNYNSTLQSNNADLQAILTTVNGLPNAGDANPSLQDKAVIPSTNTQIVIADSGYDGLGIVTVDGDVNLVPKNIAKDVNIFGVTGSYYGDGFPNGTDWTLAGKPKSLKYIYCANNIWVGITNSSDGLMYSTDGKTWSKSNITEGKFYSVYNANGLWVAANSGQGSDSLSWGIYYSIDGITWIGASGSASVYFYSIYNANGLWVAGSTSKGLSYSTDGKLWSRSNITSGIFNCVYNANGIWVAGRSGNAQTSGLYYSTDGKTWSQSNTTYFDSNRVYHANGLWVASTGAAVSKGLYYSTDGKVWSQSNITSGVFNCVYNANGIWVADNYYSTDGKTWQISNVPDRFASVYNASGIWVACTSTSKGLYYSTDGKVWSQSNITSGQGYCVYNANGIWVASTLNGLYYSVTWEPTT